MANRGHDAYNIQADNEKNRRLRSEPIEAEPGLERIARGGEHRRSADWQALRVWQPVWVFNSPFSQSYMQKYLPVVGGRPTASRQASFHAFWALGVPRSKSNAAR